MGKSSIGVQSKLALPVYNLPTSIALIVAASLCFANSHDGHFVFDDSEAIVNNEDVREAPLYDVFYNDFWGTKLSHSQSHKSYRPLTILSFRLHYYLKGDLDPAHFHAVNIALHTIVCIVTLFVFEILLEWKEPQVSFYATMLFAVHPIHAEAVSGIVGRADVLCGLFMWLSFLSYYKCVHSNSLLMQYNCMLLSVANSTIAMLCKETGITILGICIIYDVIIADKILPADLLKALRLKYSYGEVRNFVLSKRSLLGRCTVLALAGVLLVLLRFRIMGFSQPTFKAVDNPASFLDNFFLRILNYNYIYSLNLWLLLCPEWLCFDWSMGCVPLINGINPRVGFIILLWFVLGAFVMIVFSERDHQLTRHTSVGIALLVIPFLPASNLFFTVGFVLAERTLYIPSAGYCLLVALGFKKLCTNVIYPRVVLATYCALLVGLSARSWIRSDQWRTEATLFHSGLAVCPLNAKVHYNVGKNAADRGFIDYAKSEYEEAIRLNPNYAQAMNNLGNLYRNENVNDKAEKLLKKAVDLQSDFAAAWMNLGIVVSAAGRHEEAEQYYIIAISHRSTYPDCYYNLGLLYLAKKQHEKALKAWKMATGQKPSHRQAWTNMILLLDDLGRKDEALEVANRALSHIPEDSSVHFNTGNILGKRGDLERAERHFRLAIAGSPKNPVYHTNLGVLYHRWSRYDAAEAMYKKALKLDPSSTAAKENLSKLKSLKSKRAKEP